VWCCPRLRETPSSARARSYRSRTRAWLTLRGEPRAALLWCASELHVARGSSFLSRNEQPTSHYETEQRTAATMIRILFVDDESNILQALRRALRTTSGKWETHFAGSAAEALQTLAGETFDVIVADLEMPATNGLQLLAAVQARWPSMLRVLTTGSCEWQSAVNAVRVAHQLLSKPYTTATLEATIDRAMRLRDLLQDAALANLLSGLDRLPTLPHNYARLTEALRDPSRSLQDIGKLIQADAGLTAKVLQLVNSAFFGLPRRVASPAEAVSFLGTEVLQSLVLATESFAASNGNSGAAAHVEELWSHSLDVASRARDVGAVLGCPREIIENAFVAGLMHEVGSLILFQNRLAQYLACQGEVAVGGNRQAIERRTFGTTSARLAAYVLATWGLPDEVVLAVAFHGLPSESRQQKVDALAVLHLAHGTLPTAADHALDLRYIDALGLLRHMPALTRVTMPAIKVAAR
jgi:HD-like signal output (HDOD) protein